MKKNGKKTIGWLLFLFVGLMGFAAACASQSASEQPTPTVPIPGPALVQFFTDP